MEAKEAGVSGNPASLVPVSQGTFFICSRSPVKRALLSAGLQCRQPEGFERGTQLVRVILLGPPNDKRRRHREPGLQRPDGRFAMIVEKLDQLVMILVLCSLPARA
jgi:hypothetical protein